MAEHPRKIPGNKSHYSSKKCNILYYEKSVLNVVYSRNITRRVKVFL
jgi:hypothetical protein